MKPCGDVLAKTRLKPPVSCLYTANYLQENTYRSTGDLSHSVKTSLTHSLPHFFMQAFLICILSCLNHTSAVKSIIRKML